MASSPAHPGRILLALVIALAAAAALPATSLAQACSANKIVCENQRTGTDPSEWEIDGAGDRTIQGFATQMSVQPGETINFKIKSATANYKLDILRLGYYQGLGARRVRTGITPSNGAGSVNQPSCQTFADTGLVDCGNWSVSASWAVPADSVSGVYIAYLKRNDTGGESHIMFVVRDDASHSDVVAQTSDATWQAYNEWGGNSLYKCTVACPDGNPYGYKSAYKVSYNRPSTIAEDDGGRSAFFTGGEWPMVRWMERNGYDVSYVSQVDVERRGQLLANHKLYISMGHDEYTSRTQRDAIENARNAGTNLAFFSGNEMFWRTRYEPSRDGSNTPARTLVSYKDTHFNEQQDPVEWTGTWRDPRFAVAADRNQPENALTGQLFTVNSGTSDITVPYEFRNVRLWRNTAVATLGQGQSLRLAPQTLGYEWDEDADNGFRQPGSFKVSSTTVTGLEIFTDHGSSVKENGTATHNMTIYRAASGALVFGAGTVQWSWGLDDHNMLYNPADRNMQQATLNLFADMGVQPATRQSNLIAAAKSTDTTAPTSTITSPPASVNDGAKVTIQGTAADSGGGVVAGVEISTDGGTTWHPATGTTSWSYSWLAHGAPSTRIRTRAVDDSGNLQTPGAGVTVAVNCSCSIWGSGHTPQDGDSGDPSPAEVGVKFKSDQYGVISGLRFWKVAANTGTHTGSLWTAGGDRLAQATFTNETASGWQNVTFSEPVEVMPGTTYVASYHAPNGHFLATAEYFYRQPSPGPRGGGRLDSAPLHALETGGNSTSSTTNGVFAYSPSSTFPSMSYGASNYWVDVMFSPTPAPGQARNVTATAAGRTSANVTWDLPAGGGKATSFKITPYVGNTAQAPVTVSAPATSRTVTGLTQGTTYTFTVQATNPNGAGPESARSNAVTPLTAVVPTAPLGVAAKPATQSAQVSWSAPGSDGDAPLTGYTVTPYDGATALDPKQVAASSTSTTITGLTNGTAYTFRVTATNSQGTGPASAASGAVTPQTTLLDFDTPQVVDAGDTNPVELGMKFKPDHNGTITGIRFYKAPGNLGPHSGSLWTASGQRLAQVDFTGESASGWQTANFSTPVDVTAGATYVASYFAPSAHYSVTSDGFATGIDKGPLHGIANNISANGVYAYGATSRFPNGSHNATNYWVDVLYAMPRPGQAGTPVATEAGKTSVDLSWTAPATGGPVTGYKVTPYVGSAAQAPRTVDASTSTTINNLTAGTTYRFTVQAVNANGAGLVSGQSNAVTPVAAVRPSAPLGVGAKPATASARVDWSQPASDGDEPITGYVVTPYAGSTAKTPVNVPATSTSTTVTGLDNGTAYTFRVAAKNAIGTGTASAASTAVTPRATIFDFAQPQTIDSGDQNGTELGVKFQADFDGAVTGVRFYKAAANTGTHTGSLWTAGGQRLAQATFTNESATGWQTVEFSSPVDIAADTTYVVSYYAPRGHYSVTSSGLADGEQNGLLRALAGSSTPNGVFSYGATSTFPTGSHYSGDYAVDVLFQPDAAPAAPTGVTATAGAGKATVSWTAPAGGGVTKYTITPYAGAAAQTPVTVTGTPPATTRTISGLTPGTAYRFAVSAGNPAGNSPDSALSAAVTPTSSVVPGAPSGVSAVADTTSALVSWTPPDDDGGSALNGYVITPRTGTTSLTPVEVGASTTSTRVTGLTNGTPYTFTVRARNSGGTGPASAASAAVTPLASLFALATPSNVDSGDGGSVNVGVKFSSDVPGEVVGLRFYKSPANTGTHVGTLWDATGGVLARATFTGESGSGWQTVRFATPYDIEAGTTYVASYHAPNGHYAGTGGAFGSGAVVNGPLRALADATTGNGVFAYGGGPLFPTGSWNATNYWVDVLFSPTG